MLPAARPGSGGGLPSPFCGPSLAAARGRPGAGVCRVPPLWRRGAFLAAPRRAALPGLGAGTRAAGSGRAPAGDGRSCWGPGPGLLGGLTEALGGAPRGSGLSPACAYTGAVRERACATGASQKKVGDSGHGLGGLFGVLRNTKHGA